MANISKLNMISVRFLMKTSELNLILFNLGNFEKLKSADPRNDESSIFTGIVIVKLVIS